MIIAMPANKEIWANFDFLLGDRIAIKSQAIKSPPMMPNIAPLVAV